MPRVSAAMRVYGVLLHLYPAAFRNEYGVEMTAAFSRRSKQTRGVGGVAWLWLETVADAITTAMVQHRDILRQDVRYALRGFARSPLFTLTAIAVVALAVGANTAAFTAVDHVLLRPLPFRDPDRLVKLWEDWSRFGFPRNEPAPANYVDWKRTATSFETVTAYRGVSANLTGEGVPERLEGAALTHDVLPMLGAIPAAGRLFAAADDQEFSEPTVILSHKLWMRRFAGDPAVLGRDLRFDGALFRVIGIMPAGFRFPRDEVEMWIPMRFSSAELQKRGDHYLHVLARLRPDISIEKARAEMGVISDRIAAAHPEEMRGIRAVVTPLRAEMSPRTRTLLIVLAAGAACVLLIGCANLANLMLARAAGRRKELAVRSMLGAGSERLVRQGLTESLLLSGAGGAAGVLLAYWVAPLLGQLAPTSLPIAPQPQVDARVLLFGLAASLATGVLFGLLPARHASREALAGDAGARGAASGRRASLRDALLATEIAVTLVLLVCGGLLTRTLWKLQSIDPGFDPRGVLTLRTSLPMPKYARVETRTRFYAQVLERVRALPGVVDAGYVSFLPMVMRGGVYPIRFEGQPTGDTPDAPGVVFRQVTTGYFRAMGIPLKAGRDVTEADVLTAPRVAVVSESFVRAHLPGQNPVGRRFVLDEEWRTIAGVVGDVRARGMEIASEPQVYIPYAQMDTKNRWFAPKDLAVRTQMDGVNLAPAIRRAISSADAEQPVSDVRTMTDVVDAETAGRRRHLSLIGAFAALAFVLAAVGIHGVLSFLVSQRTQEIGVRMAMGAERRDIVSLIVGQGMRVVAVGVAIGGIVALLAALGIERVLYGVEPTDPIAFGAAVLLCVAVSFAACLVPALRASRLDPAGVIRG